MTNKKEWKPCGEGENICNCKTQSECGYLDFKEVKLKARDLEIIALKDALFMRNQMIQTLDKTIADLNVELNDRDDRIIQLEIDSNYNDMLVTECENLKSDLVVTAEQRDRLQNRVIELEEVANELRQTVIAKQNREIRLENILAPHQELTQWIEEVYDNDFKFLDNADFVQQLMDKVIKLNK